MDKFDVLEKYNLDKKADEEFKIKTRNHRGATDLVTKFNICASLIDKKWVETRNNLENLKQTTKCSKLNEIPNPEGFKHTDCYFWSVKYKNICKSCDFYNKELKVLEESMSELRKASKDFSESASNEYWNA